MRAALFVHHPDLDHHNGRRAIAARTELCPPSLASDIRDMLVQLYGENDLLRFEGVYRGGNGEDRPCLNLPKRETLILVSGYKLELRAKIIDRSQELNEMTDGSDLSHVREVKDSNFGLPFVT